MTCIRDVQYYRKTQDIKEIRVSKTFYEKNKLKSISKISGLVGNLSTV